uniref:glutathione transferase n=1 Tax=Dimocarpus longan TaxID=128017 RepID=I6P9H6_9ROSI|nr:glutathione S-transferase [Dimocarpus longan]AGC82239.1 glutathione S-transferase [Dimocarpus longan]
MDIKNFKVYGSLSSPATLKVLACVFEHDLDFDFVHIDLEAGEHKQPSFLAMSPFGQVPVFDDGDMKRFESRAIIRSIAHEYGKKGEELIYWECKRQAIVADWIDVEDHKFEPLALKLVFEWVDKPSKGLTPDESVAAEAEADLAAVLDVYEARLSKFKYLASDDYTIADLLHLPNLQALLGTKAKRLFESRPHVSTWCFDILARPAWSKVLEMQKKPQA